jgi:hypothetical protein
MVSTVRWSHIGRAFRVNWSSDVFPCPNYSPRHPICCHTRLRKGRGRTFRSVFSNETFLYQFYPGAFVLRANFVYGTCSNPDKTRAFRRNFLRSHSLQDKLEEFAAYGICGHTSDIFFREIC